MGHKEQIINYLTSINLNIDDIGKMNKDEISQFEDKYQNSEFYKIALHEKELKDEKAKLIDIGYFECFIDELYKKMKSYDCDKIPYWHEIVDKYNEYQLTNQRDPILSKMEKVQFYGNIINVFCGSYGILPDECICDNICKITNKKTPIFTIELSPLEILIARDQNQSFGTPIFKIKCVSGLESYSSRNTNFWWEIENGADFMFFYGATDRQKAFEKAINYDFTEWWMKKSAEDREEDIKTAFDFRYCIA